MISMNQKEKRQRWTNTLVGLFVCASLLLSAATSALAQTPAPEVPAQAEPTGVQDLPADKQPNFRQIVVKFHDGAAVKPGAGGLEMAAGYDANGLQAALGGRDVRPALDLNAALESEAFAADAAVLDNFYKITLPESATYAEASALVNSLLALDSVETAYMEPVYIPASEDLPPTTEDFEPVQLWLGEDQMNAPVLTTTVIPGALGEGIKVLDVEYGWQLNHEDLNLTALNLIGTNSSDVSEINHGTAVAGILTAPHNLFGVTGLVPNTNFYMVSATPGVDTPTMDLTTAIYNAYLNSEAGDVIVIPMQAINVAGLNTPWVPDCDPTACSICQEGDPLPVEAVALNYTLIKMMTTAGRIVVEAAGNGRLNLDQVYTTSGSHYIFRRNYRDSRAILVGAGDWEAHEAMCFTNYGSRLDLQGWGHNVTTTGYNTKSGEVDFDINLPTLTDAKQFYTNDFKGTSAATAMVAGAAASLQGVAKQSLGIPLEPGTLRKMLVDTGMEFEGVERPIGNFPIIQEAINTYFPEGVISLTFPLNGMVLTTTRRPTLDWRAYPGVESYQVQVSKNDINFTAPLVLDSFISASYYTFPANLERNTRYYWRVSPVGGKWSKTYSFMTPNYSGPANTISLRAPTAGAMLDVVKSLPLIFSWAGVSGAAGYEIQITDSNDVSELSAVNPGPDPDPEFPLNVRMETTMRSYIPGEEFTWSPGMRYYWRVRPYSWIGETPVKYYGAWANWRVFFTKPLPPEELLTPGDQEVTHTSKPLLEWAAVPNATRYEIHLGRDKFFRSYTKYIYYVTPYDPEDVISFQLPKSLPSASQYWWRVRALGKYVTTASGWSRWNAVPDPDGAPKTQYTFFPRYAPAQPKVIAPKDRKVIKTLSTKLWWYRPARFPVKTALPSGLPSGFEVEVYMASDNSLFEHQVVNVEYLRSSKASFLLEGLDPGEGYYWRVRAFNNCEDISDAALCEFSPWSGYGIFRTSAMAE